VHVGHFDGDGKDAGIGTGWGVGLAGYGEKGEGRVCPRFCGHFGEVGGFVGGLWGDEAFFHACVCERAVGIFGVGLWIGRLCLGRRWYTDVPFYTCATDAALYMTSLAFSAA
jgi:hypothetical protein